jgi:drug/metabolite transporter superfamily protein YnfA
MNRRRAAPIAWLAALVLTLLGLPARAPAAAQPAVKQLAGFLLPHRPAAKQINIEGTYAVTVTVQLNKDIVDGTPVNIDVVATANDETFQDTSSNGATVNAKGGTATVTVDIPYDWQVASTDDKVYIEVSLDADPDVDTIGEYSFINYVSSSGKLPANGATTAVTIDGTL